LTALAFPAACGILLATSLPLPPILGYRCGMFFLGLPWSLAHMALIEAKQGVASSWIAANTHWGGADASGDTYHQMVVVVHVHDSLLFFCLHPVKMVEPAAFPVDESGMALSSRMLCFPDFSA
jgi:hypothetical protein